jgi:hypothetical protein
LVYGEASEGARPSMSEANGHSNCKGEGKSTTKMITLMRLVPSRTGNVPHQKMETARVFLYLLHALGSLEAGLLDPLCIHL